MIKIKRCLLLVLSLVLLLCFGALIACDKEDTSSTPPPSNSGENTVEIVLEHTKMQLGRGEKKTINYTISGVEGVEPEWYSFDSSIAMVDPVSGEIVGVEAGETTIVASIEGASASCTVLVSEQVVEINEFKISLSSTKLVINADSEFSSMELEATLTYNNEPVNADIIWESSDEQKVSVIADGEKATVSALANGVTVIVTATSTYDGVKVSASCAVVCQGFYEVTFNSKQIELFPGQNKTVEYDLFVDGVKNDAEKSNVKYFAKDLEIISVSEDGTISAIKSGSTQILLTYGSKEFTLNVLVGEIVYVSTAKQFMAIDGEDGFVKYILQNDIDLSGYFNENPSINKSSLIDSFSGVIDGCGYTVSGWHRLYNADDTGFNGIFNVLSGSAEIFNLGVKITIDTGVSATIIATNSSARIENCLFDVILNSDKAINKVLFSINNGVVANTIIKVNGTADSTKSGVSDSGVATYNNLSLISETINYGAPNGIMVNNNFTDCYYYQTESDFVNKNGFVLDGNGVGASAEIIGANYDDIVFTVLDGAIYLKNSKNSKPFVYAEVATYTYDTVSVGEEVQLQLPTVGEGETVSFTILDYAYNDVTSDVCVDGKFTAKYSGEYYVIVYVENNGLYSYAMSTISVEKVLPQINATSVMLGNGTTEFAIAVGGKESSEFNYYSSDAKVATVSENGVITAVAKGTSSISVVEKNGQSVYTVVVTVVNSYTEVSDYESLVTALTNAEKGDYVVLTADITIDQTPIQYRYDENGDVVTHNGIPVPHAMVVDSFKGILDGQGYRIHLKFDSDLTEYLMCGLFNKIEVGAEIKNLYYTFTAHYVPSGKFAAYTSTFTRSCSGVIRNCYLESYLYPTVSSGGMEGIIGYLSNTSIATPTAYVYDTVFKLQTEIDGVIQDGGHAIRAATSNPYGYNNALIRNGANNEFYGTCSFTSALEGSGNVKYNTLYDFVNAKDGYFKSVLSVVTKVPDGNIVYADWGEEWSITDNAIYLCGRKVTDVAFEEYNQENSIAISDNTGILSWAKEIGAVDIYINGELKLSQSTNTFNVYNYIKSNYEPFVGDYTVIVDNGTRAGAIIYSIIELNNDNFIEELRKSTTSEAAMYKYFVFGEDITVKSWNGSDRGDFIGGATQTLGYHVFDKLYGSIDALGHSLNVTVKTLSTGDRFGGFIGNNYCLWQNMIYNLNATYNNQAFGLLATNAWSGGFENCFININVTRIDTNGNVVPDTNSTIINTPRGSVFKDCIVVINQTNGSNVMFLGDEISRPVFTNVVFIRDTESSLFTLSQSPSWIGRQFINCYHYRTIEDFVNGGKGSLINVASGEEYIAKPIDGVIAYEVFSDAWTINDKGVKLFDNELIKIVDTGDNVVNDEDIIG